MSDGEREGKWSERERRCEMESWRERETRKGERWREKVNRERGKERVCVKERGEGTEEGNHKLAAECLSEF